MTHETTLEALGEPFFRAGTAIYVDPRPFEALEAVVDDLPLPAWLLTNGNETEVLPGDVSPLWALGDLLSTTQSEVLRDALFNQLREEGLLDEVLAAHH